MSQTICFFNTAKPWGGGEKWHFEMAKHLHESGHLVLIFCHKKSVLLKKAKANNIPHKAIDNSNTGFLNPLKLLHFKKLLKEHHVSTLVLNLSQDVKSGGIAGKLAGVKRIVYRRGSATPVRNSRLNRFIFKNIIDEILVNSKATQDCILKNNEALFPKEHITIIPNGINFDLIEKKEFNPTYKKKNNELVLLSLGRLENEKNHNFLIDVAIQLRKEDMCFKMLIGGSGSLYKQLKNRVETNQLQDFVHLVGFIKNTKDFYKSGDVLLLPSLYEGFGFVIIEAAANKMPVIAFNNSSKPEIVKHNSTGFLTPDNDVKEFCRAIGKFYLDPKLMKIMGENAYSFTKTLFAINDINLKVERYLMKGFDSKVTAIVTTFNEEKNIENCLKSVQWVDEILIIDSFSTDNTVQICKEFGAKVLQREYNYASEQKNWAIPKAKHPWIVLLDADEVASSSLESEIKTILNTRIRYTAFWMQRKNFFLGKKVRFCGWQNDRVIRFFQRDYHRYEDKMVHEEIIQNQKIGMLKSKLVHFTTNDIHSYTKKIERYAYYAAQTYIKRNKKIGPFNLYIKPAFKFISSYIFRGGFLDGKIGWIICRLRTRETWLKAKIASNHKK